MDISKAGTSHIRHGVFRRAGMRLHAVAPSPNTILFGSVAWGVLMALAATLAIWVNNGFLTPNLLALVALHFYGGALGFAPGLWLATALFARRGAALRFAGSAIVLMLATQIATAGIFALQYRMFYAHWHSSFPSLTWFFQFSFTSAGAVYQYAVDNIYYYLPFTLACFLGFGLWFARANRPLAH